MIKSISCTQSINAALKTMSSGDTLFLGPGFYNEKIKISIPNLTLIGAGKNETIIQNKDYSTKAHQDNKEYNTFRTYTLLALADNITITDLTIKNTSLPSSTFGQAVALHVLGDNFNIEDCIIQSAQDTIFSGPLPADLVIRYKDFLPIDELLANKPSKQFYKNCSIHGDVDFIFGCGNAIFEHCDIISLATNSFSYIAAPAHPSNQKYGFTFIDCNLMPGDALKDHLVFLARPWRDYGRAVFINCQMGAHIKPEGWNKWNDTNRDKTCYFAEYSPSVNTTKRLSFGHILTKEEAKEYTREKIHSNK